MRFEETAENFSNGVFLQTAALHVSSAVFPFFVFFVRQGITQKRKAAILSLRIRTLRGRDSKFSNPKEPNGVLCRSAGHFFHLHAYTAAAIPEQRPENNSP